jgi:hypothetical protein
MNQQQQIKLLNSIMPQIVESKDPEATMLKCATANNLSPAQLEKLGHVFNSMKTLVGLEKQANRGDSFTIVDVPGMVAKYATYDPARVLSSKSEKVHERVDKLTKGAAKDPDGWGELLSVGKMNKSAGANDWMFESKQGLPTALELMTAAVNETGRTVEYTNTDTEGEWQETNTPTSVSYDVMHKAASSALEDLAIAEDNLKHIVFEAGELTREKCASIYTKVRYNKSNWAEIVEDARDCMGREKSAAALSVVEAYFEHTGVRGFEKSAALNCGGTRKLARDRHEVVEDLEAILEAQSFRKRAAAMLEGFAKEAKDDKSKSKKGPGSLSTNLTNSLVEEMGSVVPDFHKQQVDFNKRLAAGKREIALQQLMLTDDIIGAADPATVQDLYNTIADLSPTLAESPIRMAPVLKEALQYDALPIQQIKDILSVEESARKSKKLALETDNLEKQK